MLSTWSATEAAFLMVAVIQAVFAVMWALCAWLVGTARHAAVHWSVWAVLSSVTWLILAARYDSPPLIGVLAGVLSVMALQRGIWVFIGRAPAHRLHAALLVVVVVASWLGTRPTTRFTQAGINFGILAWLYLDIARDLYAYARDQLRFRWAVILALPVLLGCFAFASRAIQAVVRPESVLSEMNVNSTLNVNSAFAFVVLVLAFHSTLISLVVGRLVTELHKLSRHDALTGLLNRRAMEEALDTQIHRSRRSSASFVVMMLDLDHFKRINDQFGHAVGDLALKHVSALLHSAMRDSDYLARFGGEEFVVLMSDAVLVQAQPIAERLRDLVISTPLTHGEVRVPLSVSIGVAQWRDASEDSSHLLLRADAALFQAKVQGRNRVVQAVSGAQLEPALT